MTRPRPSTALATAALLASTAILAFVPPAGASHCALGLHQLELVLEPAGQCWNNPPNDPVWVSWPSSSVVGRVEDYCVRVSDPDGDQTREVHFHFYFEDHLIVPGPFESGTVVCQPYAYPDVGEQRATAGHYDMGGAWSGYAESPRFTVRQA